jgi:uncharacterized protein YfaA (DUF2138 family)
MDAPMRDQPIAGIFVELAKLKLRSALVHLQRVGLSRLTEKLPTALLDDVRIAATDELALRGLHVITHRSRLHKVA